MFPGEMIRLAVGGLRGEELDALAWGIEMARVKVFCRVWRERKGVAV